MLSRIAELLIALAEVSAWAEESQNSKEEVNWEAIKKCNEAKMRARHALEAILSEVET